MCHGQEELAVHWRCRSWPAVGHALQFAGQLSASGNQSSGLPELALRASAPSDQPHGTHLDARCLKPNGRLDPPRTSQFTNCGRSSTAYDDLLFADSLSFHRSGWDRMIPHRLKFRPVYFSGCRSGVRVTPGQKRKPLTLYKLPSRVGDAMKARA